MLFITLGNKPFPWELLFMIGVIVFINDAPSSECFCEDGEQLQLTLDAGKPSDGTILIYSDKIYLDTINYCLTPYRQKRSNQDIFMPMGCSRKLKAPLARPLGKYGILICLIFLLPTFLVYLLIKELRSTLGGKYLICYLFSMTAAYMLYVVYHFGGMDLDFVSCSTVGYTAYFSFMSLSTWRCVICFDIWRNFKETNIDLSPRSYLKRFAIYSLVAWGSAGLMTSFVIWSQLSENVSSMYKPGVGIEACFIDIRKWSAGIYYYWPNFIIFIFNFITFIHFATRFYKIRRDVANIQHQEKSFQENAGVIMRLFLVMDIFAFKDILIYCARNHKLFEFVYILAKCCCAIEGILIFILFVLRPNVMVLIWAKFQLPTPTISGLNAVTP